MASAEQLKALLAAHLEGDDDRFFSVAMQVAAHEAKVGHNKLAQELRSLIDDSKKRRSIDPAVNRTRRELGNLLEVSSPKSRLGEMILRKDLEEQITRIIREQRYAAEILAHGLTPRRKILLVGPPGTGKTLTASVLAGELRLPLFKVRLDGLITKFMGETAAKLRQIFDSTDRTRGVYLFDEFDAIGSQRGIANDVGEIRRVLNSFLQMIEQDSSHSLVIAATNYPYILDHALFRRFDDVLHYVLPNWSEIAQILEKRLVHRASKGIDWDNLGNFAVGLSYAEVSRAADEVLKEKLINKRGEIYEAHIREMLMERIRISERLGENA